MNIKHKTVGKFSVFGKHLRAARVKIGLKQSVAAKKIHVSQPTWSQWEIGRMLPRPENISQIERLGIPIQDFLPKKGTFDADPKFFKIPLLPWTAVNRARSAEELILTRQYYLSLDKTTHTTRKGESLFAVEIIDESMEDEFKIRDVVTFDPDIVPGHLDYAIIIDFNTPEPLFRQIKIHNDLIVFHPINRKYPDIIHNNFRYKILGTLIERYTPYK